MKDIMLVAALTLICTRASAGLSGLGLGVHGGVVSGYDNPVLEEGIPLDSLGIELSEKLLVVELLVRSESNLHCSCISYATPAQREFLFQFIDTMVEEEHIKA